MRNTKTEYVSCPSCGRTLFNLQVHLRSAGGLGGGGTGGRVGRGGKLRRVLLERPSMHGRVCRVAAAHHVLGWARIASSLPLLSVLLQEVTDQIRTRTGHLPGVSIAVMGCIVNGPGEMADADFG